MSSICASGNAALISAAKLAARDSYPQRVQYSIEIVMAVLVEGETCGRG
jgi:hypothetical protein